MFEKKKRFIFFLLWDLCYYGLIVGLAFLNDYFQQKAKMDFNGLEYARMLLPVSIVSYLLFGILLVCLYRFGGGWKPGTGELLMIGLPSLYCTCLYGFYLFHVSWLVPPFPFMLDNMAMFLRAGALTLGCEIGKIIFHSRKYRKV